VFFRISGWKCIEAFKPNLRMTRFPSWPGFAPAIHVFLLVCSQDVDARHKAGHDELLSAGP